MFERSKARDPVVKVVFGSSPDCASTLTAAACRTAHEQMSENRKREGKERHAESSINIRCRRDEEEDCSNDDDNPGVKVFSRHTSVESERAYNQMMAILQWAT